MYCHVCGILASRMEPQEQQLHPIGALDSNAPEHQEWPLNELALTAGRHLHIVHTEIQTAKEEGREPNEALVEEHRSLARPAFNELFTHFHDTTYNIAKKLTGSEDDAMDVVQEVYARVWRGLHTFRGTANVKTWLHRVTLNAANTFLEKRTKHARAVSFDSFDMDEADFVETGVKSPEERTTDTLLREKINTALIELPHKLRSVIVLRDVYDMSHDQIATELGITEAAAKVRLHRARRKLRDDTFPKQNIGRDEIA